jgi:peptidoglycan LD-endopeptidase LytH
MKIVKRIAFTLFFIMIAGILLPQQFTMPVKDASRSDYNPETFWYYPWGKSVTHKGVDIFAEEGRSVLSATKGLVLYSGEISIGGKVILVLGPKWRLHYYAHLKEINVKRFQWLKSGTSIGSVGTSGNAKGKAPHLHYSIVTAIPYIWRINKSRQGWKKMFYLNPIDYLEQL